MTLLCVDCGKTCNDERICPTCGGGLVKATDDDLDLRDFRLGEAA
jgi:rRNA maturation endonuclease Nob1